MAIPRAREKLGIWGITGLVLPAILNGAGWFICLVELLEPRVGFPELMIIAFFTLPAAAASSILSLLFL